MNSFVLFASVFVATAHILDAHSWVECVDYDPPSFDYTALGNFDRSRCKGYPRGFERQYNAGFGVDTGYNWPHVDCMRDPFKTSDYNDKINMATYKPGQTIYISHPAKGHVADSCTNPFILSSSFVVKMSSQPNVDSFDVSLSMVGGEHKNGQIDYLGYQRCYNFCGDKDKSHCVSAWTLPTDIPEGRHSFIWSWEFNTNEFYSNCFDAYISKSGSANNTTSANPTPATTVPVNNITTVNPTPSATVPANNTPSATFNSSNGTITLPPSPTPTSSHNDGISSGSVNIKSPSPSTSKQPPEIISSSAPSISSPFSKLHPLLMNITGMFNISGLVDIIFDRVQN